MKVYIVIDNSKDCYDAGGIFHSVHATLEEAKQEINKYSRNDREFFDIYEEEINQYDGGIDYA